MFAYKATTPAISEHVEKWIGPPEMVFHEVVSHLVHIDVHWVKPTAKFAFHTLDAWGMSDKPMTVPLGLKCRWVSGFQSIEYVWRLYVGTGDS